ncbi:MAG: hypothetical protein WCH43_16085 [Verrucomicrobiota bacterium]
MIANRTPKKRATRAITRSNGGNPECYSVTIFTDQWREIRDFYMQILDAKLLGERENLYSMMNIAGLPVCLRKSVLGETVSYFHLYLSLKNRQPVLNALRERGIIVTRVGPYINFRDPEGRVIKLSESRTMLP